MTTTEPTTTVPAAELDALRAIARAANVIAAGEHVDRHEREQALDALPHLCDALAAETSDASAAARSAARDRRFVERARARRTARREGWAEGGILPGVTPRTRPATGLTNAGVVAALAPHRAVAGAVRTEDWLSRMGALGALSPDHQAAYEALAQAGVQPYQLRFLATAVSCGVIAPTESGTRP